MLFFLTAKGVVVSKISISVTEKQTDKPYALHNLAPIKELRYFTNFFIAALSAFDRSLTVFLSSELVFNLYATQLTVQIYEHSPN